MRNGDYDDWIWFTTEFGVYSVYAILNNALSEPALLAWEDNIKCTPHPLTNLFQVENDGLSFRPRLLAYDDIASLIFHASFQISQVTAQQSR